jgi:phage shock protein PspC (stress-responsive transcriptional regulator)
VLAVINGVLAGIGSVYLTTHSIWITLLAAISAVFLGGLALITTNERP